MQAYGGWLPQEIRSGVPDLEDFLSTPGHILNDLFQGEVGDAAHNTLRRAFNGVFGFGRLGSAAAARGERQPSDIGRTMGVWGIPEGAYIKRPSSGPTTDRGFADPADPALPDQLPKMSCRTRRTTFSNSFPPLSVLTGGGGRRWPVSCAICWPGSGETAGSGRAGRPS